MLKINRILCPTDFSPESDEALRYALALAVAYKAKVFLCFCAPSELTEDEKIKIDIKFEEAILNHLGAHEPKEIECEGITINDCSDPPLGITEMAAEIGADLIVMRSRRRPRAAALLGSAAESVCRTAPCPVFVTHPHEREWVGLSSGDIDLKRIMVGYDYSDDSERSLNYGLSLAQEYQAELHVFHVLHKPFDEGPEISWTGSGIDTIYNSAVSRLQKAVPQDAYLWCNIKNVVRWGKPYQEILEYAKSNEIDLICMGASGSHYGIGSLFGSNADRVLRQSPCPVLIARPLKPEVTKEVEKEKLFL
jgi:nucleotide-binding universal stress UspA family protein